MCSLFLAGCTGKQIESNLVARPIYKSDHKAKKGQVIPLEALMKELEKNGVEIEDLNSDPDHMVEEYYFNVDKMSVNLFTRKKSEDHDQPVLQRIVISPNDIRPEKTQIHENPFFKSLMMIMEDDAGLIDWLVDLEEQYTPLGKEEVVSDQADIADIMAIGRTYISFYGVPLHDYKSLEIVWGDWEDMPGEFEGLVAELEHQGLMVTAYAKGFKGDMIKLESKPYYLIQKGWSNWPYYDSKIENTSKAVAYKIMVDPNREQPYSAQLYGLIPEGLDNLVKVEDMLGIDTLSRVMEMSWEDFNDITSSINEQLNSTKEGLELRRQGDYKAQGQVNGYQYEIYAEMYGGAYRFTVLIEKI